LDVLSQVLDRSLTTPTIVRLFRQRQRLGTCHEISVSRVAPLFLLSSFDGELQQKVQVEVTIKKNAAWSLARSFAESDFNENEKKLRKLSNAAADWLLDIGKEKWSLCYSPCSRYGMLTSNSVESINSALRGIRKLPILDCLLSIERYVGTKWSSSLTKAAKWNELTGVACTRMEKALSIDVDYQVTSFSDSSFLVIVYTKKGDAPIEHTVQLNENATLYTCGYQKDTQSPCTHAFVCMRGSNRLGETHRFFDTTWHKATYVTAYSLSEDMH
jgi:hypothetical protein